MYCGGGFVPIGHFGEGSSTCRSYQCASFEMQILGSQLQNNCQVRPGLWTVPSSDTFSWKFGTASHVPRPKIAYSNLLQVIERWWDTMIVADPRRAMVEIVMMMCWRLLLQDADCQASKLEVREASFWRHLRTLKPLHDSGGPLFISHSVSQAAEDFCSSLQLSLEGVDNCKPNSPKKGCHKFGVRINQRPSERHSIARTFRLQSLENPSRRAASQLSGRYSISFDKVQ